MKLPDMNIGHIHLRRFLHFLPQMRERRFTFDRDCSEYVWRAVYDDLPRDALEENFAYSGENTLFLNGNPSSFTRYVRKFLTQFGHILSSRITAAIHHPNPIRRQASLPWFYCESDERRIYDSLAKRKSTQKSRLISTVYSAKAQRHTMQHRRLQFVRRFIERDHSEIDVWGYGIRDLQNKSVAIGSCKYHLTKEKYSYKACLSAIIEARQWVLKDYVTFPQFACIIGQRHNSSSEPLHFPTTLLGRRALRKKHALRSAIDACTSSRLP